jgi:hypothetical protein
LRGRLDRHDPKLPRFVVLPASAAAALGLQHRVTVEGTLGRVPFDRRSIKPWGDGGISSMYPAICVARLLSTSATPSTCR